MLVRDRRLGRRGGCVCTDCVPITASLIPGDIPEQYFTTSDPAQLRDFASQCDILVAILPSTPQTRFLLKKEHFGERLPQRAHPSAILTSDAMPKDSVFVSVGRGDIAKSGE
jgi:phosphoglycerate dehydrogenase-like enzyme